MKGRVRGRRAEDRTADPLLVAAPGSQHLSRVAAMRDVLGNRGFGQLLQTTLSVGQEEDPGQQQTASATPKSVPTNRRPETTLSIVKITAFPGSLEFAQATLSDRSVEPVKLSQNALAPGTHVFELDEGQPTHYQQVLEPGETKGTFLWLPKTVFAGDFERANEVEVEILEAANPSALREQIAALDPAIQQTLTTDKGPVASYSDLNRVLAAGKILEQAGVTPDELLLREYQQQEEGGSGSESANEGNPVEWASNLVAERQAAGQAALETRTKLVQARETIDALGTEKAGLVRNLIMKGVSWATFEELLAHEGVSLSEFITAFESELRSVTTTFLSQANVALYRIEQTYLAKRNVGAERERLRQAIEAVRPAVFRREAAAWMLRHKSVARVFSNASEADVEEWQQELEQREQDLQQESQAAGLPVASWKGFDPSLILNDDIEAARSGLQDFVFDARSRLRRAEQMAAETSSLYKFDKMVALAKEAAGIAKGSTLDAIISYRAELETSDEGFWSTLWDIVTVALMFVPGNFGIALRAAAGLVSMSKSAEEYVGAKTRSLTGLSSEDPSSFSFYLAAGGTLIEAPQMAKGVFKVAGQETSAASAAARGTAAESTAVREGERAAATADEAASAERVVADTPAAVEAPAPTVKDPGVAAEPEQSFASLNEPAAGGGAAAPPAPVVTPAPRPASDPIVWVNTGRGAGRGRYHLEGTKWFGNTKEGVAMPRSWAEDLGFVAAGTPRTGAARAIRPRFVNGRQAESLGAAKQGMKNISATARAESAVMKTSIRADLSEAQGYNWLIDRGELGLQRPFGANVAGVDAITVEVTLDAAGRPISAKIFLNDMTTATATKDSNVIAAWLDEVDAAVAQGRLDFGDPDLEKVIRDAAVNDVYKRVVRVDPSAGPANAVTIDPNETWKVR